MDVDKKTILIVEDEGLIAMAMEDMVRDMGFLTHVASRLPEAIAFVETGNVDLAILDFSILHESSAVVAQALRQRGTPFIVCTGQQIEHLLEVFAEAPFIGKPYADADLQAAIAGALMSVAKNSSGTE